VAKVIKPHFKSTKTPESRQQWKFVDGQVTGEIRLVHEWIASGQPVSYLFPLCIIIYT
jgi:hypothetical protein